MKPYLLLLLAIVAGQSYAETWSVIDGCRVVGEGVFKWTGECPNGIVEGEGELTWYYSGLEDKYIGSMKNGRYEGEGTHIWAAGFRYEGQWKDGQRHGRGIQIEKDGSRYEGQWKDDQKNGKILERLANGTSYEGDYKNNLRNGKGVMTWSNGSYYEGGFKDDQRNGFGRLELLKNDDSIKSWENSNQGAWLGDTYVIEGIFKNNQLEKKCQAKDCDPEYDPYNDYKKLDHKIKKEVMMSKIIAAIKEDRYKDALPYFSSLERHDNNLPESFYFYYIQSLSKVGYQQDTNVKAQEYLKKYGSNAKYYAEVIEIMGR